VGRRIRAREVRVIDENGEQMGIVDTRDAMARAEEVGLQLVEVNPKATPPVCKILDYGKYKYEVAKRERDAKKGQKIIEVKEVKFRPKTHSHDFGYKVRHVRRFIEDGDKVRLLVQFRGREVVHPETGRHILDRVCEEVADIAAVAQTPSMEGNRMNMILAPKKGREATPKRTKPAKAEGDTADAGDTGSPPAAAPAPAASAPDKPPAAT
jgi:translation initiation factor IF-3